jgi:Tfp pilus assembly protein PilO
MVRRRVELAAVIAGLLLLSLLVWAVLIRPQTSRASAAATREDVATANSERLEGEIAERRQLQQQAPALATRVKALQKLFPDKPDTAGVTDALQGLADASGIDLVAIQPTPASAPVAGAPLAPIAVSLQVRGTYFQIEDFLNQVETLAPTNAAETNELSRAVLVSSLDLAPGDASDGGESTSASSGDAGLLLGSIGVTIYQSTTKAIDADALAAKSEAGASGSPAPGGATPAPPTTNPSTPG